MTKKYRKPVTEVLYAQRPNLIKQLDDWSGVWSADVTYIRVPSCQYMYLGTVYDPENQKVLAHQLSSVRDGRFLSDILLEALSQHLKPAYLHSDMGGEYTSSVFENLLETNRIRHSYSKKGHPYDNARIEAFHSILKSELIYPN
jgi:putative transposase